MTFSEYQSEALKLDRNPGGPIWYPCLGLAGEVGETIEHVKKYYRDGKPIHRQEFMGEAGDILWYLNALVDRTSRDLSLEISLEDVARFNLEKLQDRAKYGKRS